MDVSKRAILDLGNLVSSAAGHLNGVPIGIRTSPPWTFDLTGKNRAGENRIDVLVRNTLSNHHVTIPTHYRGGLDSGLIGPVGLLVSPIPPTKPKETQ